jgi:predicted RNase H-like HicB family nuclease
MPADYSDSETPMDAIRIIHTREAGYGWTFESPDVPGLIGGADTYAESRAAAEAAVAFHFEEDPTADVKSLTFAHYVPEHTVVA